MGWFGKLLKSLFGEPLSPSATTAPSSPPREAAPESRSETGIQAAAPPPRAAAASAEAIQVAPSPKAPPRPDAALQLGAADFLPIPRDEMLREAQARGRALWSNAWFGRRDLIPPADDPRTSLIDRGMVAEGLLAPRELVEIHETGAEMERRRGALEHIQHEAALAGEAAVAADRARRAAVKEQKKK